MLELNQIIKVHLKPWRFISKLNFCSKNKNSNQNFESTDIFTETYLNFLMNQLLSPFKIYFWRDSKLYQMTFKILISASTSNLKPSFGHWYKMTFKSISYIKLRNQPTKSADFWLSKSIFYVKNYSNLSKLFFY